MNLVLLTRVNKCITVQKVTSCVRVKLKNGIKIMIRQFKKLANRLYSIQNLKILKR
jgi:hypothetical protein